MVCYDIYIENFLLISFWMDYLILNLVKKLLGCSATQRRLLLGAGIGAVLSSFTLFLISLPFVIWELVTYMATGILMLVFTFTIKSMALLKRALTVFFSALVFVGGVLSLISSHIPELIHYGGSYLTVIGIGTFFCINIMHFIQKERERGKNTLFSVTLRQGDVQKTLRGLWDTGNHLTEPLSGKTVSIIEGEMMEELIRTIPEGRLRIVPFHSVGCKNGVILAYRIDEMTLRDGLGHDTLIKEPYVGVYEGKVSKQNTYQIILPFDAIAELN